MYISNSSNSSALDEVPELRVDESIIVQLRRSISTPESMAMVIGLSLITLLTIIGNTMVIISIFTYKPLKNVQNMFLVNLAITDISVAIIVLPFSIIDMLLNHWVLGTFLCQLWLTSDVLLCTASILNLCTIALDRYWAIYDPINYAQRRTIKQVLFKIACVWLISALISIPPLFGLNNWPEEFAGDTPCKYSEHLGYVIYSASGSFYIPLLIMSVVYLKIYRATSKRLRGRVKASSHQTVRTVCDSNSTAEGVREFSVKRGEPAELVTTTTTTGAATTTSGLVRKDAPLGAMDESVRDSVHEHRSEQETREKEKAKIVIIENIIHDAFGSELHNESGKDSEDKNGSKAESSCEDSEAPCGRDEGNQNKYSLANCQTSEMKEGCSSVQKFWEEKEKISLSKERRAARILGVVMGVFTICWSPFFIMYLIIPFYPNVSQQVKAFITWLGYVNSALNPIIYTIFNVDFRRAFKDQLSCCKFKT